MNSNQLAIKLAANYKAGDRVKIRLSPAFYFLYTLQVSEHKKWVSYQFF